MKIICLYIEKLIAIISAISFVILVLEYNSFPLETKTYYFLTLTVLLIGMVYGLIKKRDPAKYQKQKFNDSSK